MMPFSFVCPIVNGPMVSDGSIFMKHRHGHRTQVCHKHSHDDFIKSKIWGDDNKIYREYVEIFVRSYYVRVIM